jgi:hypothetical protein
VSRSLGSGFQGFYATQWEPYGLKNYFNYLSYHLSSKNAVRTRPLQVQAAFCLLFVGLQKVRRLAGRVPPVFGLYLGFLENQTPSKNNILTSPVPAGSRVTFFSRPKRM